MSTLQLKKLVINNSIIYFVFNFSQIDLSRPVPPIPAPTMGSGILAWGGEFIPPASTPDRDFLPDYIVTVIVPFFLAILLSLILTYVMCCRREGV